MEGTNGLTDRIARVAAAREDLKSAEAQLRDQGLAWLEEFSKEFWIERGEAESAEAVSRLAARVERLFEVAGSPEVNAVIGRALTLLIGHEIKGYRSRRVMDRLLGTELAGKAQDDGKRILVVNAAARSTKLAFFAGAEKLFQSEAHVSLDETDTVDSRVSAVISWLSEAGVALDSLDGIACRSGFFRPVPTGTYRLVPEMVVDLERSRFPHTSNLSVPVAMKLAEMSGRADQMLLTTSDPSVSDEIETVERLTGFIKIRQDGTGVHYLNHTAVMSLIASVLGRDPANLSAVAAHLGDGVSLALYRGGRFPAVVDAFTGAPSSHRCGPLGIHRLLEALKGDQITIKELERVSYDNGGLLSLAGTDDFRSLDAFRNKGATEEQRRKIDLIFEFFARRVAAAALRLTADGLPVSLMVLTGGLVRSQELVGRIEHSLAGRYPLVLVPDSIEAESLAAGLIRSWHEPESLREYVGERNALARLRETENSLLDTVIFDRTVTYRKKDAPIASMDELVDAVQITVKEHFLPTIAIVGADNEEAILAAKRANEEGKYRIARFKLVGDFAAINQIAYDFDLVIDNDNFSIVDTDNPVEEAVGLLDRGEAHILMKGKMHTAHILKGVFQYLRSSGRITPGELISHVFVMDIPVRSKLLLISDAAVNTYPDEEKRIKILENSLKVARSLYLKKPKVAIISAIETVSKSVESSMEAERIAERFAMRDDCIVEGPLSFDVAMDVGIAHEKNYTGQIAGTADILILPDIDAGNVLYKSLTTQSGATSAGVILGGDMPMILTSRGDSARSKLSSIALAVKMFFDLRDAGH